jgi:enterochelin esterase family protein
MSKGQVVIESFESECLKKNPLGDPHIRQIPVYLPAGYDNAESSYPVIYMITGFTGKGISLLNFEPFAESFDQRLDRLIDTGKMKPAIVVMPDCYTYYGGSQYINSPATGEYETHLIDELVPFIRKKYRVSEGAAQSAIVGKSSGGYGAIVMGMRHPEIFGVVACHSGDMAFEYCYMPEFPQAMIEIERCGGIQEFIKDFYGQPKKKSSSFPALNIIAMGAAYSGNADGSIDLPFDLKTCEIREDVWQHWLKWDPIRMMEKYEENLRQLKIFIDCGKKDEFNLYAGARIFSTKLAKLDIAHVYEEFDDTHMKLSYRYDTSLEFISKAFGYITEL